MRHCGLVRRHGRPIRDGQTSTVSVAREEAAVPSVRLFAWKHLKDPTSKACLRNMPLEHASALDRRHASVVPFGTWAVGMLRCVPLSVGPSACSGSFVCEVPRSIVAVTSHRSGRSYGAPFIHNMQQLIFVGTNVSAIILTNSYCGWNQYFITNILV